MRRKFRIRRKNLVLQPVDSSAGRRMRDYRQGDLLADLKSIPIATSNGIGAIHAKNGAVIISQTCDLVLSDRLSVQVAPLIFLPEHEASQARDGKRPRFVHIPDLGPLAFADLEVVATLSKEYVSTYNRKPGVHGGFDVGVLGRAIGRRFSRYPFPDEVTPWLSELERLATTKSHKPATPEHEFFEQVVQLRMESSNGWGGSGPYELTLIIIVQPGTLPMFENDEIPEMSSELFGALYTPDGELKMTSVGIATRLKECTSESDTYWLWQALGESWARVCRPPASASEDVLAAVKGGRILSEVVESNLYTIDRLLTSEMLDLDHLSTPADEDI